LNVLQDTNNDGNLNCALIATSNDLLLQIYENLNNQNKIGYGLNLIKKLLFSTTCLKVNSKFLVDPQSLEESSLSNNLQLTTCYMNVKEFEYLMKKNEKINDINNKFKIDVNEI
jgi:exosome complex RNA-binding protein Rrp42 (RNase PH superfamily)